MNVRITRALCSLGLAASALLAGCYSMPTTAQVTVADGVLTSADGMTLYTFDRDTAGSGKSVCNGPCATLWPPMMAAADGKTPGNGYSIVVRDDGSKQLAYKGLPLYHFARDTKAGDKTGDGFNKIWRTAKP